MPFDPETQRALADRVRFYRELGIHDFYRRPVESSVVGLRSSAETPPAEANAIVEPTTPIQMTPSPRKTAPTSTADDRSPKSDDLLQAIRADIGDCTRCRLHKGRTNLVFGVGSPNAELMFIGEGPGADEDAQGIPFVGRAGQLLTNMIKAMGLEREQVYIANVVKCRPPGNRTPERDECNTCGPFLMRQIVAIRPKVIVALGATAAKYLLQVNDSMANLRGHWYDFAPPHDAGNAPIRLAVTYHPAYLLRDPRQKGEAWKDLQMVMKELGLKPPAKQ